jgi:hypothetical protein
VDAVGAEPIAREAIEHLDVDHVLALIRSLFHAAGHCSIVRRHVARKLGTRDDVRDGEEGTGEGGDDLVDELSEPVGRARRIRADIIRSDVEQDDLRRISERPRRGRNAVDLGDHPSRMAFIVRGERDARDRGRPVGLTPHALRASLVCSTVGAAPEDVLDPVPLLLPEEPLPELEPELEPPSPKKNCRTETRTPPPGSPLGAGHCVRKARSSTQMSNVAPARISH